MMREVQTTLRIDDELHRKLRFIAADKNVSFNELVNQLLWEATVNLRVSVPSDLLAP